MRAWRFREELPSRVDELIGEERREELAEIKKSILQEIQKMGERTDKGYLHAASHLRRNPTAVSVRFKEAIEELRKIAEQRKTEQANKENTGDREEDSK